MLGTLADVKAIELTGSLSGAFCAKMLADMGADTLKIEPPGRGDPARMAPPFLGGVPHADSSSTFLAYNTNKRGITLDVTGEAGQVLLKRLAADADVLIESFSPGRMAELGLGFDALHALNPRLILVSLTPFGQSGPRRGWLSSDLIEQALGGQLVSGGDVDKRPLALPLDQAAITTARNGAIAAMAALFYQRQNGQGQPIDVSSVEAMVQTPPTHIHAWSFAHTKGGRGGGGGQQAVMDSMHLKTKDGYVTLATAGTGGRDPLDIWADFLGEPKLKDPKYKDAAQRRTNWREMRDLVEAKLADQTSREFLAKVIEARLVAGIVQSPLDIVNCEQLAARDSLMVLDHPVAGTLRYPGVGFITPEGNPTTGGRAAPLLGQHNTEVYCGQLGYSLEDMGILRAAGVI